jgi:phosphate transport system substrate-binding protein
MFRKALAFVLSTTLLFSFSSSNTLAKEINVSGSTSVARIMDVLAEDYNNSHSSTYIAVQGVGTTAGITLLKKGVVDLAMSSRYLNDGELESDLIVQLLAFDGLAVVVNLANPVEDITREELYDIYKGKITNWKEVGGLDQKIAVVTREASSGSRFSFESLIGLTRVVNDRLVSDINKSNLVVNSNSMVKTIVNHNPQAIGFVSTGSVDRSIKALQFEGVTSDTNNISNGSYQLSRPFLILHYGKAETKELKTFIDYLKSDRVRQMIIDYGYIPPIE